MKNRIKGLLIDLDGVVYVSNRAIPGAAEAVEWLRSQEIPFLFVTNTTTDPRRIQAQRLQDLGLPIFEDDILSAVSAGFDFLKANGYQSCFPVLSENVREEFSEFLVGPNDQPEAVVIGDIGHRWDFKLLNKIFNMVMEGATLIGLHRGKFFLTEAGLEMDIGAFITGIEYATQKQAIILGKPQANFFQLALQKLGLPPNEVAMIGDDVFNDVEGAQKSGMQGVLVKTGKYREDFTRKSGVLPDAVIDSIVDIQKLLESLH